MAVSWSYSGDPSASPLDAVRFYISDTDRSNPILGDAEIEFLLKELPNPIAAAAAAAEAIAAAYSRFVDRSIGPLRISYSQRVKQFKDLADSLWVRAGGSNYNVAPLNLYSGGQSLAEKEANAEEPDLPQPFFTRTMFSPLDQPSGNPLRSSDDDEGGL